MKTKLLLSVTGSILFILMSITSTAQWWKDWEKYEDNPVILGSDSNWFSDASTHAILYEDGKYKMWFTGLKISPWLLKVGYAESEDGLEWDIHDSPVIEAGAPYTWNEHRGVCSVIRVDDTLRLWYETYNQQQIPITSSDIGYAWSLNGIQWNLLPDPVLEADPGSWESDYVSNPTVYYDGDTYHLYYASNMSVGYATSDNGIDWDKYGDEALMEPDLIDYYSYQLMPAGLLTFNDTIHMWFTGASSAGSFNIGYAWSTNYVDWTIQDEPALEPTPGTWDRDWIQCANVLLLDDAYHMWYTGSRYPMAIGYAEGYKLQTLCMNNGVAFTSQVQIDNFLVDFPYCIEIGGEVEISGSDITNLDGLGHIKTIDGYLKVFNNEALEDFSGMDKLETINGDFWVYANNTLTSCSGLDMLNYVQGDLLITVNNELSALDGLENLTYVGEDLRIMENAELKDISGLANVDTSSFQELRITDNENLSWCSVTSVCDFILDPNHLDETTISGNTGHCEDLNIVYSICDTIVDISETLTPDRITLSPNPFSQSITITYDTYKAGFTELSIYNSMGRLVANLAKGELGKGEHQFTWNAANLPAGFYFCVLKTNTETKTTKIVKMK